MKKSLIILMSLLSSGSLLAQVGISTENPQQLFHVDGKSSAATTNPTTGVPSIAQQADDIVITNQGRLGIGTINPSVKLNIVSEQIGAIKIVDGTQGQSKVLMSDDNGVGSWQIPASIKAVALGDFTAADNTVFSTGGGVPINSKISINLTRGRWVVNAGLNLTSHLTSANRFWQHFYLSSSTTAVQQNGFTHLGPANNNTSYAGVIHVTGSTTSPPSNDSNMSFISGSSVINVTTDNLTLHLLIENKGVNYWQLRGTAFENYFYAIPLN